MGADHIHRRARLLDRLYCIANPDIDVDGFNRLLGTEVLSPLPDPDAGILRLLATEAAVDGLANMTSWPGKSGAMTSSARKSRL